jgi:hypothetical protein
MTHSRSMPKIRSLVEPSMCRGGRLRRLYVTCMCPQHGPLGFCYKDGRGLLSLIRDSRQACAACRNRVVVSVVDQKSQNSAYAHYNKVKQGSGFHVFTCDYRTMNFYS